MAVATAAVARAGDQLRGVLEELAEQLALECGQVELDALLRRVVTKQREELGALRPAQVLHGIFGEVGVWS